MYTVGISPECDPETFEEDPELLYLVSCGLFMDSVHERCLHPVKMLCDRLISEEHELFYQLVRTSPLSYPDTGRYTVLIECDIRLIKVKIEASSVMS